MFRTLVMFALLRRLRMRSPEMFDAARALAAINACIEQDLATFDALGAPGARAEEASPWFAGPARGGPASGWVGQGRA